MLKKIILGLCVSLFTLVGLTACGDSSDSKTLKVGVAAGPYGDMFKKAVAPGLKAKGYNVEILEFSDYVQPNLALNNKSIDINLFQHLVYMNNFKKEHNLDISAVGFVPTAGAGVFSNKITDFSQLKPGDKVTISNDITNESRALRILQSAGLIKLNPNADQSSLTPKDIIENSYQLEIIPIAAAQTPRSLDSAVLSVVNGNYAIGVGLDLSKALYTENLEPDLKNIIAIRTADMDTLGKEIISILQSKEFNDVIEDPNDIFHTFQKPNYQLF